MAIMDIALPLAGTMAFWLGILNIGEKAGVVQWISRIVGPFFSRLFPDIPRDHAAHGQMMMNFSANMLGLDNAATPFGLQAMSSLQACNPSKDVASNAQIMLLVLLTSGLTILPISIIAQRAVLGAQDPTDIFIPTFIATYIATLVGIALVAVKQRINLWNRVMLTWLVGFPAALGARVLMIDTMQSLGADSLAGRLASIFQGTTDTTFYIIALYFGSVGIKNVRYAITLGLLADLAGALAAIGVTYLFFN